MKQPRYRFTRSTERVEAFLTGSMTGDVRKVELVFYTKDHSHADATYDALLTMMKEEGWRVELIE
jgi:hypothetical protein